MLTLQRHQRAELYRSLSQLIIQTITFKIYLFQQPERGGGLLPVPLDPGDLPPRGQRFQDPPVQQRRSSFWPPFKGLNQFTT